MVSVFNDIRGRRSQPVSGFIIKLREFSNEKIRRCNRPGNLDPGMRNCCSQHRRFSGRLTSILAGSIGKSAWLFLRYGRFRNDIRRHCLGASHPKQRVFSMGKLHKYTGYATILAAAAAAVSGSDDGFHKGAGDATAALAVATCITGFYRIWPLF